MSTAKDGQVASQPMSEDEIFKSLTHQVRRDVIRFIGERGESSFSTVKRGLDPIESPSLSYHLKSLYPLVLAEGGQYKLSTIGQAALNLLAKVDQGTRIARGKRNFLFAYIITVICWIVVQTLVPMFYAVPWGDWSLGAITILLNCIAPINFVVIWMLRKSF